MSDRHRVCPVEGAGMLTGRLRSLIHNPKKILGQYIKSGDVVLDFGCGPGFFTCPAAGIVGYEGRVIAVDLQQGMLDIMMSSAEKNGLSDIIETRKAEEDSANLSGCGPVDLALAFYVVHEVPDGGNLFSEIHEVLKPGGRLLVIEPSFHVKKDEFEETVRSAQGKGFELVEFSSGFVDRKAVFRKTG